MKGSVFVLLVFAVGCSVADEDVRRGAFYSSLANMSHDSAAYTFMVDQLLASRCGRPQSIETVKTASESEVYVIIDLKNGRYADASARINSIPCEK